MMTMTTETNASPTRYYPSMTERCTLFDSITRATYDYVVPERQHHPAANDDQTTLANNSNDVTRPESVCGRAIVWYPRRISQGV
jgi:hypothetical protein